MPNATFNNLRTFLSQKSIGLGWLDSISVMETDRAVLTDWHRHKTTEMLFCLRGETHYEFRGHDTSTLYAGHYLIVPAGVEHRVLNTIDEPGKRIGLNLRSRSEKSRRFSVFEPGDYLKILRKLTKDALVARPCPPETKHAIAEINRLVQTPTLSSVELGYLRILCCATLYTAVLPPKPKAATSAKIMDEAVKWLEAHYSEKISIDRLVLFMGYSRARFFTLFRSHTGLSPSDYLMRFRIRRAQEMLTTTSDSVRSVAAACGFQDTGYFVRVFKRQIGFTPQAFRERFGPTACAAETPLKKS